MNFFEAAFLDRLNLRSDFCRTGSHIHAGIPVVGLFDPQAAVVFYWFAVRLADVVGILSQTVEQLHGIRSITLPNFGLDPTYFFGP